MTVYVDPLMNRGWLVRGSETANCHLFTDELDLSALHALAVKIGMKRAWFQDKAKAPHYDLTPGLRLAALEAGAMELGRREAVMVWRARRASLGAKLRGDPQPPSTPRGR